MSDSKEQSEPKETQPDIKTEPAEKAATDNEMPPPQQDLPAAVSVKGDQDTSNSVVEHIVVAQSDVRLEDNEKEARRLFSETRRLLQLDPEHAMTLAELVDRFRENEDPCQPSSEQLYQVLTKFNVKDGTSGGGKPAKHFQVRIYTTVRGRRWCVCVC